MTLFTDGKSPPARSLLVPSLVFLFCFSVHAQEKETLVIMDLKAIGVDQSTALNLSERMRAAIASTGTYILVSREEMENILKEHEFQKSDMCDSTKCFAEIGGALGAKKMIAGSVGKVGETYTLALKLIDITQVKEERSIAEDCKCPVDEMLGVVDRAGRKLVAGEGYAYSASSAGEQPFVIPLKGRWAVAATYGGPLSGDMDEGEFKIFGGLREYGALWGYLGIAYVPSNSVEFLGYQGETIIHYLSLTTLSISQAYRFPLYKIEKELPGLGKDVIAVEPLVGFILGIASHKSGGTSKRPGFLAGITLDVYWVSIELNLRLSGSFSGPPPDYTGEADLYGVSSCGGLKLRF